MALYLEFGGSASLHEWSCIVSNEHVDLYIYKYSSVAGRGCELMALNKKYFKVLFEVQFICCYNVAEYFY